jgi:hypothetical protein
MRRNQLHRASGNTLAALIAAAILFACADVTAPVIDEPLIAEGRGGSVTPGGVVAQGDFILDPSDAPALASTCPSQGFSGNSWAFVFGKSLCLIVAPNPWTGVLHPTPYVLLDDIIINVTLESGKNGRITHVRVAGQDVDGPEGIWHNTDWIPVAEPVVPSKAGFTLHVHAKNVAVWRTDSHLAGGNKVEIVGYVSIGDMVYPKQ